MYDVTTQFSHNSRLSKWWRKVSHARMVQLCEETKYDTGRDLFALEALAAPSSFSEFHLLQLLLSSYISHLKDESKRKLAPSSRTIRSILLLKIASMRFAFRTNLGAPAIHRRCAGDPLHEQVAEHFQLQTQVGQRHMRTKLKK